MLQAAQKLNFLLYPFRTNETVKIINSIKEGDQVHEIEEERIIGTKNRYFRALYTVDYIQEVCWSEDHKRDMLMWQIDKVHVHELAICDGKEIMIDRTEVSSNVLKRIKASIENYHNLYRSKYFPN